MRKEAKKYLSLYLLQHTKIQRLQGQLRFTPKKQSNTARLLRTPKA